MARASAVHTLALVVTLAVAATACASSDDQGSGPRRCARDLDCGDHHYCSEAAVCRTDCFVDVDCYGPTKTAQCNSHGRCVETDLDATPADVETPEAAAEPGS